VNLGAFLAVGLGINRIVQDIILITGHHRAKSWIDVAFPEDFVHSVGVSAISFRHRFRPSWDDDPAKWVWQCG
jgi:hypothetical protein